MKTKDIKNNTTNKTNKNSRTTVTTKIANTTKPTKVRFKRTKIFFGILLSIIVLIVTINTIKTLYIGHIEINEVKATRAKISEIATALSEVEPKTAWADESSCYEVNSNHLDFFKEYYSCKSLHKAVYGEVDELDRQKIMDKTTEIMLNTTGLDRLEKKKVSKESHDIWYGYRFYIEEVRDDVDLCTLTYSYNDSSKLLEGELECVSFVSKYTHDKLK